MLLAVVSVGVPAFAYQELTGAEEWSLHCDQRAKNQAVDQYGNDYDSDIVGTFELCMEHRSDTPYDVLTSAQKKQSENHAEKLEAERLACDLSDPNTYFC